MEATLDPDAIHAWKSAKGSISQATNGHSDGFQYNLLFTFCTNILVDLRFVAIPLLNMAKDIFTATTNQPTTRMGSRHGDLTHGGNTNPKESVASSKRSMKQPSKENWPINPSTRHPITTPQNARKAIFEPHESPPPS